jgi:SAM-dependent methyltransferase
MQNSKTKILVEVADYYSSKLAQYGETPQGVDWNGEESQTLRFSQLCKIIGTSDHFSVNDLGCGYGALYDFLTHKYTSFSYFGSDVSKSMIQAAENRYQGKINTRFELSSEPGQIADYSIASGIFNVRMNRPDDEWIIYLETILDILDRTSNIGFAFNCLTSYSDPDKKHGYLYYANPYCLIYVNEVIRLM